MAIDFQDVAEGVFQIDHAVWLLARKILAYGHALLATSGNYFGGQSFDIWILDAEVEYTGLPVLEVVLRLLGIAKLKDLYADPITCGQVRNTERTPAGTKYIGTHDSDS
ncbi:hypothetical protein QN398_24520 [Pseudomonas sp. CCC2.2]|nr:hypothetical protein [Pseudomonas sp. CCC2.2]